MAVRVDDILARPAADGRLVGADIAVTSTGVYVVQTRPAAGARIRVRRVGGLVSPRREELRVRGRDRSVLARTVAGQADLVRDLLGPEVVGHVTVTPVLCLLDADLPGTPDPLTVGDVLVVGPAGLERLTREEGPLAESARHAIRSRLESRLGFLSS